jgi:hypothetical protein
MSWGYVPTSVSKLSVSSGCRKEKQKCLSEEEVVDVDEEEVADEVEEEVEEEALTWGHPQQVRLANTVSRIGVLTYFILPILFFFLVLFPGVPIQPCICLIAVVPLGIFLHACEDEMIYKSVNEKGKDFLFYSVRLQNSR